MKKNSLLVHRCPSGGRVGRSGKGFFFLFFSFFFFLIALKSAMWSNILHIKHSHSTEICTNNTFKVKSAFILQCSNWNYCVSTMYNNMKCPILKPYLKIWQWRKLFTGGTSLHGPPSFADTCPCTNTSCRSLNTTSNTSDIVIFISKVLIILIRDFRACFTSNGERSRVRCIHSVRHFCNGISNPGNDIHEY